MELELRDVHVAGSAVVGAAGPAQPRLDGVDLQLRGGECVAVMGGNGAGKSTLALVLGGVLVPTSGTVSGSAEAQVRVVLQRPESSFLTERVADEVALAAVWAGGDPAHARELARATCRSLGLPDDVLDRDPLALSGGEQRRVAIAAALAAQPTVLVLDEPSAGLDAPARRELHAALAAVSASGRSIVLITHDAAEAASLASRLVVLRSGRVAFDGTPAEVLGDPGTAAHLGIGVAPEVALVHELAYALGRAAPQCHDPRSAGIALVQLVADPGADAPPAAGRTDASPSPVSSPPARTPAPHPPPTPDAPSSDVRDELPPAIDARVRFLAVAIAVAAALTAVSLVAAGAVAAAVSLVAACARIPRARLRRTTRSILLLAVSLALLQLVVGARPAVVLTPGVTSTAALLAPLLRTLQIGAIAVASLVLTSRTPIADLAAAARWLLAPLRPLRVPVDQLAFVTASGIGLLPLLDDELDRLRTAQLVRGIDPHRGSLARRARAASMLLLPLVVSAFRRAHLLADALAVRGIDPAARPVEWRPRTIPAADVVLLLLALALLVLAVVLR